MAPGCPLTRQPARGPPHPLTTAATGEAAQLSPEGGSEGGEGGGGDGGGGAFDGVLALRSQHYEYMCGLKFAGGSGRGSSLFTASYDGSLRRLDLQRGVSGARAALSGWAGGWAGRGGRLGGSAGRQASAASSLSLSARPGCAPSHPLPEVLVAPTHPHHWCRGGGVF